MAKRPSGQGLLSGNPGDPEAHSPGSQASNDFTGWPWSVRHDYKQLNMDSSSAASSASHPSRMASWGNQEDYDAGLPAANTLRRMQQAVVLTIFLNALTIALELIVMREDARRVLKFIELCLTVVFMMLVMCTVRAEVTKMSQAFCAKQAISEADRKEEMIRTVRADLVSFREASLRQKAEADKEVQERFANLEKEFTRTVSKADAAAAYAIEQITAVRQDVQSARIIGETANTVASAAAGCLEDMQNLLLKLQAASDCYAEKLREHEVVLQKLAPDEFSAAEKAVPEATTEGAFPEPTKPDGGVVDEASPNADQQGPAQEALEEAMQVEGDELTVPSASTGQEDGEVKADPGGAGGDSTEPSKPDSLA